MTEVVSYEDLTGEPPPPTVAPLWKWYREHADEVCTWFPWLIAALVVLLLAGLGGGPGAFGLAVGVESAAIGAWAAALALRATREAALLGRVAGRLYRADVKRQITPIVKVLEEYRQYLPRPTPPGFVVPLERVRPLSLELLERRLACAVDLPASEIFQFKLEGILLGADDPAILDQARGSLDKALEEAYGVLFEPEAQLDVLDDVERAE